MIVHLFLALKVCMVLEIITLYTSSILLKQQLIIDAWMFCHYHTLVADLHL